MFIVLEGLDGAGKSTQIKRLVALLKGRGIESEYVHFPRFDAPVYGELIARFLRGELGSVESVDPYIVALLFAGDRADMAQQIRDWQAEGKVVIVDRYVYSNIGYQCAKIADAEGQARLKQWILDTEYGYYNIPRPDLSIFLDVPFSFTAKSLTEQRAGEDRAYLNGGSDIHESSLDLQQMVRRVYLEAAQSDAALKVVDCSNAEGGMDSPDGIFARIEALVAPLINNLNNE
ncbi:MAG: dTMP kinase [Alistipes sp.]|nr:dTMP kinase [Alistipes sp.]